MVGFVEEASRIDESTGTSDVELIVTGTVGQAAEVTVSIAQDGDIQSSRVLKVRHLRKQRWAPAVLSPTVLNYTPRIISQHLSEASHLGDEAWNVLASVGDEIQVARRSWCALVGDVHVRKIF